MTTPDARIARTTRAGAGMPGDLGRRTAATAAGIRQRAATGPDDPADVRWPGQLGRASQPTEVDVPPLPGGPLRRDRGAGGRR
ncbi:MAG: hypothetical protein JJT89_16650 [Nitriliruptoraceae bacterium]|nr:hypothetical protein [Nitriliruptoraceae bacterium]